MYLYIKNSPKKDGHVTFTYFYYVSRSLPVYCFRGFYSLCFSQQLGCTSPWVGLCTLAILNETL